MNFDLTTKQETICIKHNTKECLTFGMRYREWETDEGIILGWGCECVVYPEFTTQKIREERVTYANDQLQSHRGGELSREFLEAHPKRAKRMLKDGAITKEDVKKAKYVWKSDVKGVTKKIDAEVLIK